MKKTIPIILFLLGTSWLVAGGCKGYHDACKMAGGKLESGAPNKYEFCRVKAEAAAKDACEERAKKNLEVHPLPDSPYPQVDKEQKIEWGNSKFEAVSLAVQAGDHVRKGDVLAMGQEVIAAPWPSKPGTVSKVLVSPGDIVTVQHPCNDNEKNGDESDVDCGGADCPLCVGSKDKLKQCNSPADCQSGVCELQPQDGGEPIQACDPPASNTQCSNGKKDVGETDVDCGGSCTFCGVGKRCAVDGECWTKLCLAGVCELPPLVQIDIPVKAQNDGVVSFVKKGCTCANTNNTVQCTSTDPFKPGDGVKKGDTILCVKALPKGTFVPTSSTQDAGTSSPAEEAVTAGFGSLFLQSSPTQDVLPPDNGVLQSIAVKETDIVAKDKVLFTVTVGVVVPDAPEGTIYPLDLKVHTVSKPGDTYDSSVTTRAPVTLLSPNMEARGPIPVTAPTAGWVTKVKPKVGDLVSDGSPVVFLNIAEDRCEVSPDPNTPLPRKLDPFPECSEDDRQQSCVARCIWLSANCADIGKLAECSRAWREYELGTQACPRDADGGVQKSCAATSIERVPPQPYEAANPPEYPYPYRTNPQLPDPNRVLTLWEFFHKRNYHGTNYPFVLLMLGGAPKELELTETPAPCPGLSADTTRCLADCLL